LFDYKNVLLEVGLSKASTTALLQTHPKASLYTVEKGRQPLPVVSPYYQEDYVPVSDTAISTRNRSNNNAFREASGYVIV
jgi:hypothetical protein